MSNRERILNVALRLFNERGTATVSTNQIAAAAAVSPGNLYYHFQNKEEVIRALFERLFETHARFFALPEDHAPAVDDLRRMVRTNFDVLWEYRFTYRELPALLRRDELLRTRWLEVHGHDNMGFRGLVAAFATAGILATPADRAALERIADACWLVNQFWLPSLEVSGQSVDVSQLERGVGLILQVLNPLVDLLS